MITNNRIWRHICIYLKYKKEKQHKQHLCRWVEAAALFSVDVEERFHNY